jgi:hypothetical protein
MDIRQCEICDKQFIAGYGYSLSINWLVTGSAHVPAYLCPKTGGSGQHWGCCPEHAVMAALRCLNEHMHEDTVKERHMAIGKPRYADEDAPWAEALGDNFHIVTVRRGDGNIVDKI